MNTLSTPQPKTYIFSIAISNYKYLIPLPNAIKDADSIIETLTNKYKIEYTWRLDDAQVNSIAIENKFIEIQNKINKEDSLLILFNGHGDIYGTNNRAYWAFSSTREHVKGQKIEWYEVYNIFKPIIDLDIQNVALIVNSCFSGNLFSQSYNTIPSDNGEGKSRVLFTSGLKYQKVQDSTFSIQENSPFASSIVEALKNNTDELEFSLAKIISYTKTKYRNNDFGSTPRDGYFGEHGGGDFLFYLIEDIEKIWQKTITNENVENYERFLDKFPTSIYSDKARKRRDELINEQNNWLEMLNNITNIITKFKNTKCKNEQLVKDTNKLSHSVKELQTKSNIEKNDIIEWNKTKDLYRKNHRNESEKIEILENFIRTNPQNKYKIIAENRVDDLKKRVEERNDWKVISKSKRDKPINRRARVLEYITKYPFRENPKIADNLYQDISLYVDALESLSNGKIEIGRKLLKQYQVEFPNGGDYKLQVKRKLDEIDIEKEAKNIALDFEDALNESNHYKINEIVELIDGFSKKEKDANQHVYSKAKIIVQEYVISRKTLFDKILKSKRISELRDFVQTYSNDKLSEEYVQMIQNILNDEDKKLFDTAEETKEVDDFEVYLSEFKNDGLFSSEAEKRIVELLIYQKAETKVDYENYIRLYLDKNGLKIIEAKAEIAKIDYITSKAKMYKEVIDNQSIQSCENYMKEYENDKDKKWNEIDVIHKKLAYELDSEERFKEILLASGEEQYNLCTAYISRFSNSSHIEKVKKIEKNAEEELKCDGLFENAKQQMTIEAFEKLKEKFPKSKNYDKANDFIDFITAKKIRTIDSFENYLNKYGNNGLNKLKAEDGIQFLLVFNSGEVDKLNDYLKKSKEQEFKNEAENEIQRLNYNKKVEGAFNKAKEINTPDSYFQYISIYKQHNDQYYNYAVEQRRKLKLIIDEDMSFRKAKESKSVNLLSEYMYEYRKNGRYLKEASKLLYEIEYGITVKEKEVLNTVKDLVAELGKSKHESSNLITNLTIEIKKSTEKNLNSTDKVLEQLQKSSKNQNRIFIGLIIFFGLCLGLIIFLLK